MAAVAAATAGKSKEKKPPPAHHQTSPAGLSIRHNGLGIVYNHRSRRVILTISLLVLSTITLLCSSQVSSSSSSSSFSSSSSSSSSSFSITSIMPWTKPLFALFSTAATAAAAANNNGALPDCIHGPLASTGVCNTSLPVAERARALVEQLTTAEKMANLVNSAPGVARLGLPAYQWWSEALHGVADSPGVSFAEGGNGSDYSYATSFPMPINLGATFDKDIPRRVAAQIAVEARIFNNAQRAGLDFWTPNINPFKDPRWGRGQETPGEDARHLEYYVRALLEGFGQQDQRYDYRKIAATCKHYAAYDLEKVGSVDRHNFDAQVTLQELSEYYLPPFKACVDGHAAAFMCSYNAVNGKPSCANEYLLQTILREHWGWNADDNWITGDCGAIDDIWRYHKYAGTAEQGAAAALKAGTDLDCGSIYASALPGALNQSLIVEADLDRALVRLYSSLVKVGYFDAAPNLGKGLDEWRQLTWADMGDSSGLAYEAAVLSLVLVKNDGVLPLQANQSIALVGPWANATKQMQGNYEGPAPHLVSPLEAATQLGLQVHYAAGSTISGADEGLHDAAIEAARNSDVIVFVGGIDSSIEAEGHDRSDLRWPAAQLALVRDLAGLGKRLVVVQMGGGQVDSSELLGDNGAANALVWGGYPGQDGGRALVDVLLGVEAPSGRLPVTSYPAAYADQVAMTDMRLRPSNSTPGRTHAWYAGAAVVPFGHGLHYTDFTLEWRWCDDAAGQVCADTPAPAPFSIADEVSQVHKPPALRQPDALDAQFLRVSARVANVGARASRYAALLFVSSDAGPEPRPRQALVDYARVGPAAPGSSVDVDFVVRLRDLVRVADNGDRVLYPGLYSLWLDRPAAPQLAYHFELAGKAQRLDAFPPPPSLA